MIQSEFTTEIGVMATAIEACATDCYVVTYLSRTSCLGSKCHSCLNAATDFVNGFLSCFSSLASSILPKRTATVDLQRNPRLHL